MVDHWPSIEFDLPMPWNKARRAKLIDDIDGLLEANTREYKEVRKTIKWESPRLDPFSGRSLRFQNLRMALITYSSEKLETMKKGFEEL